MGSGQRSNGRPGRVKGARCPFEPPRAISSPMLAHMNRRTRACRAFFFLLTCTWAWSAPPVERTEYNLLGTSCTVRIYAGGSQEVLDAAFARIAEIEKEMTVNRSDSEVVRVNAAAGLRPVVVTADVLQVIQQGLRFSSDGDGAYDITVEPLVKLWGIGSSSARVPAPEEIRRALGLVGYRSVVVDPRASTIFLKRAGMGLDLGSIAKGYAADEVGKILQARGVNSALIDLGGNILTLGKKPDGSRWRIGIQNPQEARGTKIGFVEIEGGSVTTAGTYERFFEQDGKRYFHILDARTGFPAWNGLAAVAIVAPNSTAADGYDTLVFTLGLERGRSLVESSRDGIEAVFVTEKREVYVTPGLRQRFTLTDSRFSTLK
jgi:thiamine biosynthesis lipoprotein